MPEVSMDSPQGFVEEIDFNELMFQEVVGKGAFGVVSRARWRDKDVAVKLIETESERKAFMTELKQLSRVSHPNIVKLYGACTRPPTVCLVMEYAEGGSLYNVLHGTGPQPNYTAAHAMSWALQCARGVEYLHGMKPKALIHRDLKPPNLLLIMGGTVLKICDFGTACDIQTHMTNNKGSAAWMAPEVFEGSNYSEKCDVFSWGIILWEVFTRRKPFDEIGGPAFRIMWAVHNGTRPPLIRNLPKPLDILMTRCWAGKPAERPSMAEVVRIMSYLFQFFSGADEYLVYPSFYDDQSPDYTFNSPQMLTNYTNYTNSLNPVGMTAHSVVTGTNSETVRQLSFLPTHRASQPIAVEEDNRDKGLQKSAPPSLAASRESLIEGHLRSPRSGTPVDHFQKRYSADLTKLEEYDFQSGTSSQLSQKGRGHRRIGSDEYTRVGSDHAGIIPPLLHTGSPQTSQSPVHHVSTYPGTLNNMGTSSRETTPQRTISYQPPGVKDPPVIPASGRPGSWTSEVPIVPVSPQPSGHGSLNLSNSLTDSGNFAMHLVYQALDHQYQPIAPCPSSRESMEIFEQHCRLAHDYLRIQTEIALLEQRRHELMRELEEDVKDQQSSTQLAEEFTQLSQENESLKSFHKNLSMQLEQIRKNQNKRQGIS
ncbi:hypothetical protein ACJMK2_027789 [Sinanodonta woodiana]|uniref:Mitogen-activated protein kinase kinase kinase 7 n=1 Tax=Sinanodonta woodiana TaxID=1069815 RepID=A0ABD3X5L0_SINWO